MATRKPAIETGGNKDDAPETENETVQAPTETGDAPTVDAPEGQTEGADVATQAASKSERKDESEQAKKPKQPALSDKAAAVFKGLKGQFRYLGAPLSFQCAAGKEHNLATGKNYDISQLPKHVLIANALMRKTLVPAPKAEPTTKTKEA